MRSSFVGFALALSLAVPAAAQAQRVVADIQIGSGPTVIIRHRPRVAVVERRYAPRIIVVEHRHHAHKWWKRHGYHEVRAWYDDERDQYYEWRDGYQRPGLREVVVYTRDGRYYQPCDDHRDHRNWDDDRGHRYHEDD